jgi:excinuclease ABC subunit B
MYADDVTGSMARAMEETSRRREVQADYNREHGIVPKTIVKSIEQVLQQTAVADSRREEEEIPEELPEASGAETDRRAMIERLGKEMLEAAEKLEFELAASLRDKIFELEMELGGRTAAGRRAGGRRGAGARRSGRAKKRKKWG